MADELTASIMLRLSSPDEEDRTGFETQEAHSRAIAERLGARVIAVRKDDGWSGVLRQRPGFLAWMKDGAEGADLLIAWKSDRISRGGIASIAPLVDLANGINPTTGLPSKAHRPRILTAEDGVDSSQPRWETIFSLHAEGAKGERDATSARLLAHRASNRKVGRAVGGRRPWLFETVPNPHGPGSVRRPVAAHADAVRWALDHLRKGGSKAAIVREWTARKLKPKGSAKARKAGIQTAWHITPITRILNNPNLYGATVDHDQLLRNEDGTVRIDEEQAALTYLEFVELQHLLAKRATSRDHPNNTDDALCAGLLYCGSCERVMGPHRPRNGRVWTYRCRGGSACPATVSVKMEDVETFLLAEFRRTLAHDTEDLGGWMPEAVTADPVEVAKLTEAITAADSALEGDLSDDEALVVFRQRRDLRIRLAALQDAAQAASTPTHITYRETKPGRTYGEAFDAAETILEKAAILGLAFNNRVTVHRGTKGTFDPDRLEW
ncbi:recombinase family protein [Kribbella sp. NBC_01505]|uniref:recombinase family protein n=1 Tax=Kribbella sp. NBC_01505 TaxID=2903580 RepID=UPI00386A2FE6